MFRRPIFKDRLFTLVLLAALAFSAICGFLSVIKYRSFSQPDYDFTMNIQKYWNILHGDGRVSLIGDVNILGNSFEIIAYPLSVVYFLLFSSPEAILVLQAFIIGLGAIPIFLILRMVLNKEWAACLALSYLLNPATWNMAVTQYYDLIFCLLPLSFAFYFLKKDRFNWFIFCVLLTMSFRADLSVFAIMFGVYSIFDRKPLKWAIVPMVIGAGWLFITLFVIRPVIFPRIAYEASYSHSGGSFPEIMTNMILHPIVPLEMFISKQNAIFISQILLPVVFLPLFALKEFSICSLTILQRFTSNKALDHTINLHYASMLLPFIYISSGYALSKIVSKETAPAKRYSKLSMSLLLIVPVVTNLWYGPLSKIQVYSNAFKQLEFSAQKEEMIRQIPPEASVISTFNFSSHLANRRRLYSFHFVTCRPFPFPYAGYRTPGDIDYALIDFADPLIAGLFMDQDSDVRIRKFLERGKWRVLNSFNTVVLLKRGYTSGERLFEANLSGSEDGKPIIEANDKLALLWYDVKQNKRFLKMRFRWQCLEEMDEDIWLFFQVFDKEGRALFSNIKPICYGIYPARRWSKGERVYDSYNMFLPATRVKSGDLYSVKLTLVSSNRQKAMDLKTCANATVEGGNRLLLSEFNL